MSAREPEEHPRHIPAAGSDPKAPGPSAPAASPEFDSGEEGFWSAYWERFRRQQVDDPIDDRREGMWDRFRRQQVDDPVRRGRT